MADEDDGGVDGGALGVGLVVGDEVGAEGEGGGCGGFCAGTRDEGKVGVRGDRGDADEGDLLQVGAVVAGRKEASGAEGLGDVSGRHLAAGLAGATALKGVAAEHFDRCAQAFGVDGGSFRLRTGGERRKLRLQGRRGDSEECCAKARNKSESNETHGRQGPGVQDDGGVRAFAQVQCTAGLNREHAGRRQVEEDARAEARRQPTRQALPGEQNGDGVAHVDRFDAGDAAMRLHPPAGPRQEDRDVHLVPPMASVPNR